MCIRDSHNINPPGYTPPLMFKNADTRFERITRLRQMLDGAPQKLTLDDHRRMQHDAYSLRAAADLPKFRGWTAADPEVEKARAAIAAWDGVYAKDSVAATLFNALTVRPTQREAAREALPVNPTQAQIEERLAAIVKSPGWKDRRWGEQHTRAFRHPLLRPFDLR